MLSSISLLYFLSIAVDLSRKCEVKRLHNKDFHYFILFTLILWRHHSLVSLFPLIVFPPARISYPIGFGGQDLIGSPGAPRTSRKILLLLLSPFPLPCLNIRLSLYSYVWRHKQSSPSGVNCQNFFYWLCQSFNFRLIGSSVFQPLSSARIWLAEVRGC